MSAYSVVQTGPKTALGGLKDGLVSVTYQEEIEDTVKTEPIMPASSDTAIAVISLKNIGNFILKILFKNIISVAQFSFNPD